jgi:glutaminase
VGRGPDHLPLRGFTNLTDTTSLGGQELLTGLSAEMVAEIDELGLVRHFHTGERIISVGTASTSIFFVQSGMVSVKLADGVRLATLVPGTAFGEMALFEGHRTADV